MLLGVGLFDCCVHMILFLQAHTSFDELHGICEKGPTIHFEVSNHDSKKVLTCYLRGKSSKVVGNRQQIVGNRGMSHSKKLITLYMLLAQAITVGKV